MPPYTKKAIIESFLRVAGKKSLEKITVRDIVDDCGVNRNTFYYYFQDIYAVLEEICRYGLDRIPKDLSLHETVFAAFDVLSGFTMRHPRAMRQIAISSGVEGSVRYLGKGLAEIFAACLDRLCEGKPYPPDLPRFLRNAFLSFFMSWLKEPRPTDPKTVAESLTSIAKIVEAGLLSDKKQ